MEVEGRPVVTIRGAETSTQHSETGGFLKRLSGKQNPRRRDKMEEGAFTLQTTGIKLNHQYHYI